MSQSFWFNWPLAFARFVTVKPAGRILITDSSKTIKHPIPNEINLLDIFRPFEMNWDRNGQLVYTGNSCHLGQKKQLVIQFQEP